MVVTTQDFYNREGVGSPLVAEAWTNRTVTIPDWERFRSSVQFLWVQLLVGSKSWSQTSPPPASQLVVEVNGRSVAAETALLVASSPGAIGWATVSYHVPGSLVDSQGRLDLAQSPSSILWNGSAQGPWVRVLPASGVLHALVDVEPTEVTYELTPDGHGYILGFPLRSSYVVNLDNAELPAFQLGGAVLRWPLVSSLWQSNVWLQAVGLLYGLILILATAIIMYRYATALPDPPRTPDTWTAQMPRGYEH